MSGTLVGLKPIDSSAALASIQSVVDSVSTVVSGSGFDVSSLLDSMLGSGDTTIGVPNVNVGNRVQNYKCSSSAIETSLFAVNTAGFAFVQAHNHASASSSAIVRVYNGSVAVENIIAYAVIPAGTSQVVLCMPAFSEDGSIVTVVADGTNPCCVSFSYYSPEAVSPTNFQVSDGTQMNSNATSTNYSSLSTMNVGKQSALVTYKSLLKFDLSSISAGSLVSSAQLLLTSNTNENSQTDFAIHQCLRDWVLAEATWNSYSSGNAWDAAGGTPGVDYAATPVYVGDLTDVLIGDQLSFDVTDLVRDWVENGVDNYGFWIQDEPGAIGEYIAWITYNSGTPAKRPVLVVNLV